MTANQQTKFPADLLMYLMDWDQDITGSGGNAMSVATRGLGYVNGLRSAFGRDPTHGEILAAHAFGSAGQVKAIAQLAEKKPEDIAQPMGGGKKMDVIYKKLRNGKEVKRTNREVYDFFWKRIINGRASFKMNVGNQSTIENSLKEQGSSLLSNFQSASSIIPSSGVGGLLSGLGADMGGSGKSFFQPFAQRDGFDEDNRPKSA